LENKFRCERLINKNGYLIYRLHWLYMFLMFSTKIISRRVTSFINNWLGCHTNTFFDKWYMHRSTNLLFFDAKISLLTCTTCLTWPAHNIFYDSGIKSRNTTWLKIETFSIPIVYRTEIYFLIDRFTHIDKNNNFKFLSARKNDTQIF
jgi:hypothetical protein